MNFMLFFNINIKNPIFTSLHTLFYTLFFPFYSLLSVLWFLVIKNRMDEDREMLTITVNSRTGTRLYKINKHTQILKLLQSHCQKMDTHYRTFTFLLEGERFDPKKTPAQLNLKNGSIIDALLPVDGGGRSEQQLPNA